MKDPVNRKIHHIIALLMILAMYGCSYIPSLEKVFSMSQESADKRLFNVSREKIRNAWGEPDSFFSGMYGDIYCDPNDEDKLIGVYYDGDTDTVMHVVFFDRQK